jgi:hypothetical protein
MIGIRLASGLPSHRKVLQLHSQHTSIMRRHGQAKSNRTVMYYPILYVLKPPSKTVSRF